jgi:hypothetical protein
MPGWLIAVAVAIFVVTTLWALLLVAAQRWRPDVCRRCQPSSSRWASFRRRRA